MKKKYHSDMARIESMKDEEIDFSDCPELTEEDFARGVLFKGGVKGPKEVRDALKKAGIDRTFFARAKLGPDQPTQKISLRIPLNVLAWWKSQGKGYQTRMIALIQAYMEDQENQARPGRRKAA